ncbi:hypothetical protein [Paraburkholderia sp. SIMBA_053]|uniref:hypothetical protein n=1 Tax=Paraburkholderia sp. SIMBA_053 TaxID=3085794 RepID=UPI00397E8EC3
MIEQKRRLLWRGIRHLAIGTVLVGLVLLPDAWFFHATATHPWLVHLVHGG